MKSTSYPCLRLNWYLIICHMFIILKQQAHLVYKKTIPTGLPRKSTIANKKFLYFFIYQPCFTIKMILDSKPKHSTTTLPFSKQSQLRRHFPQKNHVSPSLHLLTQNQDPKCRDYEDHKRLNSNVQKEEKPHRKHRPMSTAFQTAVEGQYVIKHQLQCMEDPFIYH